jgi:hypothetical protein
LSFDIPDLTDKQILGLRKPKKPDLYAESVAQCSWVYLKSGVIEAINNCTWRQEEDGQIVTDWAEFQKHVKISYSVYNDDNYKNLINLGITCNLPVVSFGGLVQVRVLTSELPLPADSWQVTTNRKLEQQYAEQLAVFDHYRGKHRQVLAKQRKAKLEAEIEVLNKLIKGKE